MNVGSLVLRHSVIISRSPSKDERRMAHGTVSVSNRTLRVRSYIAR